MMPLAWAVPALLAALPAAWYALPLAERLLRAAALRRNCAATRSLVLTYDDGPGPATTPALLDLLRDRGVRATFFPAGFRAAARPDLVDRIVAEGHEIGCHAHAHLHAWRTGPLASTRDLLHGYRTLARWIRSDAPFRPPHGKLVLPSRLALAARGAPVAWWTIAAGDVEDELPAVGTALEAVRRDGGGVVLHHDFDQDATRRDFVLRSTALLLDAAEREGWSVRPLGAVLAPEVRRAA